MNKWLKEQRDKLCTTEFKEDCFDAGFEAALALVDEHLKPTLKFYEGDYNWDIPKRDIRGYSGMSSKSLIEYDTGKKAREAIQKFWGIDESF